MDVQNRAGMMAGCLGRLEGCEGRLDGSAGGREDRGDQAERTRHESDIFDAKERVTRTAGESPAGETAPIPASSPYR